MCLCVPMQVGGWVYMCTHTNTVYTLRPTNCTYMIYIHRYFYIYVSGG